jgi:hypothetical protein
VKRFITSDRAAGARALSTGDRATWSHSASTFGDLACALRRLNRFRKIAVWV